MCKSPSWVYLFIIDTTKAHSRKFIRRSKVKVLLDINPFIETYPLELVRITRKLIDKIFRKIRKRVLPANRLIIKELAGFLPGYGQRALAKIAAKKTFKQTILSRLSNDLQMPTVDILRELTKSKRQSLLQLPETKIISSFDKYFEDRAILKRNYAFVPSSITVDRIVIEDTTNDLIIRPRVQNNFEEFQKWFFIKERSLNKKNVNKYTELRVLDKSELVIDGVDDQTKKILEKFLKFLCLYPFTAEFFFNYLSTTNLQFYDAHLYKLSLKLSEEELAILS